MGVSFYGRLRLKIVRFGRSVSGSRVEGGGGKRPGSTPKHEAFRIIMNYSVLPTVLLLTCAISDRVGRMTSTACRMIDKAVNMI